MEGILLRRYGGFYYVESEGRVWTCRLRGRFRLEKETFIPGDRVEIIPTGENEGIIEALKPRKNFLERPAVANVEQVVVVFALNEPPPDLELLDRLLFLSSIKDIKTVIVWNKVDIVKDDYAGLPAMYKNIGYEVLITSAHSGQGLEELKKVLAGRVSTLAGPSGVGKSSLLNALQPELNLATGEISKKMKRGKHTTRHAELLSLSFGGWVADTPGFSRLKFLSVPREEVAQHFPDMVSYLGKCRFNTCLHREEPECAVILAVESGKIYKHRYEHYLAFLDEIIELERNY